MSYPELDALRAQVVQLEGVLDDIAPGAWGRPTRCTEFDVRELTAHLGGALSRYASLVGAGPAPARTHDRVRWWTLRDPDERSPIIAKLTKEAAGDQPGERIRDFTLKAAHGLTDALDRDPVDLVGTEEVGIEVREMAAVAVLESGVHTMDLGHALARGERLAREASELIVSVLDTIVGEPLPVSLGWTPRTLILTATGRRDLLPNERWTLGSLADRFPIIR
ncbi:MAG TPA: maleylpyruvate isomerase N-terminal domain-containing protein [Actinomycetota bacterium]|nr:maleylpyruvate isomerase N-terminal domain-containing protein [Actinomycetota bacterium]